MCTFYSSLITNLYISVYMYWLAVYKQNYTWTCTWYIPGCFVVVGVLTLTRIIKSVVMRRAPVNLELRITRG